MQVTVHMHVQGRAGSTPDLGEAALLVGDDRGDTGALAGLNTSPEPCSPVVFSAACWVAQAQLLSAECCTANWHMSRSAPDAMCRPVDGWGMHVLSMALF